MSHTALDEALLVAQAALDRENATLDELRSALRDQETVVARVQAEVAGLHLAIERANELSAGGPPPVPLLQRVILAAKDIQARSEESRTALVIGCLEEAGQPMSPSDLTRVLQKMGRTDNIHMVSATLSHLAKQGKVERLGRGRWQLAQDQRIHST